jgi:hypothetical protein
MFDFLWDLHQQRRINDVQGAASDARSSAHDAQREARDLRTALEQMTLANRAMWELVRDRLNLSDEELVNRMQEIDLRDGVRDGRITPSAESGRCTHCNRKLSPRHERCIYCGQSNPRYAPFVSS